MNCFLPPIRFRRQDRRMYILQKTDCAPRRPGPGCWVNAFRPQHTCFCFRRPYPKDICFKDVLLGTLDVCRTSPSTPDMRLKRYLTQPTSGSYFRPITGAVFTPHADPQEFTVTVESPEAHESTTTVSKSIVSHRILVLRWLYDPHENLAPSLVPCVGHVRGRFNTITPDDTSPTLASVAENHVCASPPQRAFPIKNPNTAPPYLS